MVSVSPTWRLGYVEKGPDAVAKPPYCPSLHVGRLLPAGAPGGSVPREQVPGCVPTRGGGGGAHHQGGGRQGETHTHTHQTTNADHVQLCTGTFRQACEDAGKKINIPCLFISPTSVCPLTHWSYHTSAYTHTHTHTRTHTHTHIDTCVRARTIRHIEQNPLHLECLVLHTNGPQLGTHPKHRSQPLPCGVMTHASRLVPHTGLVQKPSS